MSKWLGPGVLKVKKGKDVVMIHPGKDFEKGLLDESRFNKLLEDGFIDGVKARKTNPSGSK